MHTINIKACLDGIPTISDPIKKFFMGVLLRKIYAQNYKK